MTYLFIGMMIGVIIGTTIGSLAVAFKSAEKENADSGYRWIYI